ncbi:MAG: hypothetical protein JWO67_4537 [Streptosporangiaceae bacterium]|nr:hypothetical protein [Streptosporangiaceae bacterium]
MSKLIVCSLAAGLVLGLAGCSDHAHYVAPPPQQYSVAAICTTATAPHLRVDDSSCPIGDGDVPGYPFHWVYNSTLDNGDFDYPMVGYPVPVYYGVGRPYGYSTLQIQRGLPPRQTTIINNKTVVINGGIGRAARTAAPATSPVGDTKPAPAASPSIQRGGFGAPSAPRAASTPRPFGTYSSGARSSGGSFSSSSKGGK